MLIWSNQCSVVHTSLCILQPGKQEALSDLKDTIKTQTVKDAGSTRGVANGEGVWPGENSKAK